MEICHEGNVVYQTNWPPSSQDLHQTETFWVTLQLTEGEEKKVPSILYCTEETL